MGLKVLSALNKAQTQCYHFQAIIIAGMDFFTDAYDLFCIPPISNLLGRLYYDTKLLPPPVNSIVNAVALCGTFAGQLFFAWLGDRMGRKKVYGITLTLMVASSIASGFSLGRSRTSVLTGLCFFRFWLGLGIGRDYPLFTTIMAEYSNTKINGAFIVAVFTMQSLKILGACVVAMIVSACFMAGYSDPTWMQHDMVWRIILMFGVVLTGFTYYWRMKMPKTTRYTVLVAKNAKQATTDMSRVLHLDIEEDDADVLRIKTQEHPFGLFSRDFVKLHGLHLLGTTFTWFFVDIAFYSNNLFEKDIYESVGWLKKEYGSHLCKDLTPPKPNNTKL